MKRVLLSTVLASTTAMGIVFTHDAQARNYSAELVVEWQNEYASSSDDPAIDEQNNSFLRAELAPTFTLNEHFFIDGVLVFEPFDQAAALNAGNDIWFDREGMFIEEIKLNYENGNVGAWLGKFNPGFGTAWDNGYGIWSKVFAEDYEITEKLGIGASYTVDRSNGASHTLSVSTFFADTTFLTDSIITERDRVRLSDGGAGNTEDFSSFTISLDGENLGGVKNLNYHLGARFLGEQDSGQSAATDDETGFAASLNYSRDLNDRTNLDVLLEYVTIDSFEGVTDADREYYTANAIVTYDERWNAAIGYTLRDIDESGTASDFEDTLMQVSAGYDFQNGFTAEAGWKSTEESSADTDILGFLVRYTTEF